MPFVAAPNIAMIEWRCSRNGQNIENRLMVDMLEEPTAGSLSPLSVLAWNWWENDHATLLSSEVNIREVVCTSLHTQNGPQVTYAPDSTTFGLVGGFELPNEVSLCVSLRSGARGRSARGRWYMLSLTDGQMAGTNDVTAAHATACAVSLTNLITTLTGAGLLPVVVSYRTNNAPRPGGPVYFPITTALVVDTIVDSMKRRKPGVGT